MSSTKSKLTALCDDVLAQSAEFAQRMRGSLPLVLIDVGHNSNDAFLLRSFVSMRGDNQGDELAMTVNITRSLANQASQTISIESDLCLDDGTIVTAGPYAELDPSGPSFEQDLVVWSAKFSAFLDTCAIDALNAVREMIVKSSAKAENSFMARP